MDKLKYFLAAIYITIKAKRTTGTPYFNTRLLITTMLLMHYFEIDIIISRRYKVSIVPLSKSLFLFFLIFTGALIIYILGLIFPVNELQKIQMESKDIKFYYNIIRLYIFLNFGIMGYILFFQ